MVLMMTVQRPNIVSKSPHHRGNEMNDLFRETIKANANREHLLRASSSQQYI